MDVFEELGNNGVDVKDGIERFLGNKTFYISMMTEFYKYLNENNPEVFIKAGDYKNALSACHTLKGMTGNLSFTELYRGYSDIVSFIRTEKYSEAENRFYAILPLQNRILEIIKYYEGE